MDSTTIPNPGIAETSFELATDHLDRIKKLSKQLPEDVTVQMLREMSCMIFRMMQANLDLSSTEE